jgi:YD repeat-containing protein
VSTSAQYDALGRLKKAVDENAKATTYDYLVTANNTYQTTITLPDLKTQIEDDYLDGSPKSISGTAAVPETFNSGVDSGGFWMEDTTNAGQNTQRTYYNAIGQAYRATQTGTALDSHIEFDALGRPKKEFDLDGTTTIFGYDALGQLNDVILDANHDGVFSAGDRETTYSSKYTKLNGKAIFQTDTVIKGGSSADSTFTDQTTLDGNDEWKTNDGVVTHDVDRYLAAAGASVFREIDADGSTDVVRYANGLPASETQTGTDGRVTSSVTYPYDSLLRLTGVVDLFGGTTSTLLANGLVDKTTLPDGRYVQVTGRDNKTYLPTAIRRTDGSTTNFTVDSLGRTDSTSGAGTIPTRYSQLLTRSAGFLALRRCSHWQTDWHAGGWQPRARHDGNIARHRWCGECGSGLHNRRCAGQRRAQDHFRGADAIGIGPAIRLCRPRDGCELRSP